ncbi:MAG: ABC transporter permease [Lacunisphaera sp.]
MKFIRQFRALFRRKELDTDMAEEMRHHVELQTELNLKAGMDPDEARSAALRQFGNVAVIQEYARTQRGSVWLEQLGRDLGHGIRAMRKHPGFAVLAILTLGLGIGLNLAVVSLGAAMFFRPLPGLRDVDRLVRVGRHPQGYSVSGLSYPEFAECRATVTAFSELAAYREAPFTLAADQRTERVLGEFVSGNYFRTLGVTMAAGRDFLPEEDVMPGRNPVAIISDRLWQQRWQRDPGVIGREVTINGRAFTVVGVAERGYRAVQLPSAHDLWVPLHMRGVLQPTDVDSYTDRQSHWLQRAIGRLAPGQGFQLAREQLTAVAARNSPRTITATDRPWTLWTGPYSPFPGTDSRAPRIFLGLLAAITALVLATISANVASLFLARALARRREVALRLALGASRGRVVRQFLAEGLAVAAAAGALGLGAANLAGGWIVGHIPGENGEAVAVNLGLDWRLVLAGLGLVLAATLSVGLLPAWQGSRVDLLTALKAGEGGQSGRRSWLRSLLVVAQIALCVVLLVAAGLMYRSQRALATTAASAQTDPVLLARIDPALNGYDAVRGQALYGALLERIRSLPGVRAAAWATITPFYDGPVDQGDVAATPGETASRQSASVNLVSDDYFASLGLSLLRGRDFARTDGPAAAPVVIVNRTLAQSLWTDGDALGRLLYLAKAGEPPRLVVGIVSDDPFLNSPQAADEPHPVYYLPLAQQPLAAASLQVRATGDAAALLPPVQAALRGLDPNVPLFQTGTLQSVGERALWQQRVVGQLVTGCSLAAVALALMGLYAVVAQEVARRTREIGIRVAIGADRVDVLGLVLRQGMKLVAVGLALGLGAALGVTRLLQSVLSGVSPTDPLTFVLVTGVLAALAATACWLPARRAAKVDPVVALRTE